MRLNRVAIYAKKVDIKNIGMTIDNIYSQFEPDKPGFKVYEANQNPVSIIAGNDDSNLNEILIKEHLRSKLKTLVLPIITANEFKTVKDFFKLQEFAQKIIKDLEIFPSLEDVKLLKDLYLSYDSNPIVEKIIDIKGYIRIKDPLKEYQKYQNDMDEDIGDIEDILNLKSVTELESALKKLLDEEKQALSDHDNGTLKKEILQNMEVMLDRLKGLSEENKKIVEDLFKDDTKAKDVIESSRVIPEILKGIFPGKEKEIEDIYKTLRFQDVTELQDVIKLLEVLSEENKKIIENIFKIQDIIKINDNDRIKVQDNYHKIKEILNLEHLSNVDFNHVIDYFMVPNN